jgi:hypothetical protein
MTPMDAQDFEQMKAAVAGGTAEGQRVVDEEHTGEHRLPTPASKVGKAFWSVIIALATTAIVGSYSGIRWLGVKETTDTTQTQELKRHDDAIIFLGTDKASKVDVQKQIDTWTEAQTKVLDSIEKANTRQHDDMNGKLDKLLWEMKRSGGTR